MKMKNFTLLNQKKRDHTVYRRWQHNDTGTILEEFQSPYVHRWSRKGATADLAYWIRQINKKAKKGS